jgi:hypothetical protein
LLLLFAFVGTVLVFVVVIFCVLLLLLLLLNEHKFDIKNFFKKKLNEKNAFIFDVVVVVCLFLI